MTDELQESIDRIRELSPKLNAATDEANAVVARVEKFLNEECSIGTKCYVHVRDFAPVGFQGPWIELGYDRADGGFRIVVLVQEDDSEAERDEDGELPLRRALWGPWANCPRDLKLAAFVKLPELLQSIAKATEKLLEPARKTTAAMKKIAQALNIK